MERVFKLGESTYTFFVGENSQGKCVFIDLESISLYCDYGFS